MAKLLTDSEFQRFSELQQKQASFTITSEEADELRSLVERAQQTRDSRAAAMQTIEAYIAQFEITPEELFSPEQIGDAARTYGLLATAKKERNLPPTLTFNGKPYQWTRALPDEIRVPLFDAFKAGESIKRFLATPKDASRNAATIARLERETGGTYAEAWLDELSVSRTQVDEAAAKLAA
ncbi:hypothetical protein WKR88_16165 [Trinickia caryophylli]|uniref:Uncharacterized protein n=1 Tax=Trinickia caryophylli TaxID=28094 RepID=A0A1X7FPM3_TRICW|nr:hypothetical protein [Trinickia caryophylli]PMS09531.1 hypothetical protein C0Z17_24555 [Trinickia caryophylli]TRX14430.1 hypothetical protein FNF07_24470 [Trinickia caryophylli]WQE14267.1 hypothetical protein U0034_26660 [Trinickia caryophylli]SMF56249.1 hypothetical protein SAMN06295900_110131 [Trinickia caryophylli]GLU33222.1 hypothetical protein Busp01_30640 [Trinickia caryophylli]